MFRKCCLASTLALFAVGSGNAGSAAKPSTLCATPTITVEAPARMPSAALPAPLAAHLERCRLKPGLVATYRNNVGGTFVQSFLGYPEESEPNCGSLLPPCYEWLDDDSNAKLVSFVDGDLNPLSRYHDVRSGKPYFALTKLFRWPLTIPDAWETDYVGPNNDRVHRNVKVVGWENLSIPAGHFEAIRIEVHDTNLSRFPQFDSREFRDLSWREANEVYYYDPALGFAVKFGTDAYPVRSNGLVSLTVRSYELTSLTWEKPQMMAHPP